MSDQIPDGRELADALEKADWSNTSIGNKVLIKGAIENFRSAALPEQAGPSREDLRQQDESINPQGLIKHAELIEVGDVPAIRAERLARLAAKPADDGPYLVWSNQHKAWWRPDSRGYTMNVSLAGRYSREEAMKISAHGRDGWTNPKELPEELAIAERDIPTFSQQTPGESK